MTFLSSRSRGPGFKYHFQICISEVLLREGLVVPPNSHFSIAWKRGDKIATTKPTAGVGLRVVCEQTMSLVCTMYKSVHPDGGYAPKDASLTLLYGRQGRPPSAGKSLGKVQLDLAPFATIDEHRHDLRLTILHDGVPVGDITCTIFSRWLRHFSRPINSTVSLSDASGSESGSEFGSTRGGSSGSSGWPTADEDTETDASDSASDVGTDLSECELDTDEEIEAAARQEEATTAAAEVLSSSRRIKESVSHPSPHRSSRHLTAPHLASPHIATPRRTSAHLTASPHLAASPQLATCQRASSCGTASRTAPSLTMPHHASPCLTVHHHVSPSPCLTIFRHASPCLTMPRPHLSSLCLTAPRHTFLCCVSLY